MNKTKIHEYLKATEELVNKLIDLLKTMKSSIADLPDDKPSSEKEYQKELDYLLKHYNKMDEDELFQLLYQEDGTDKKKAALKYITNFAQKFLHPSREFINTFQSRLALLPCADNDSMEYNNWAIAGGVDDGEEFMSNLDIWEWTEYYDNYHV